MNRTNHSKIALLMLISVSVKGQHRRFNISSAPTFSYEQKFRWTVDTTVGVINYLQKTPDSTFDVKYGYAMIIDSAGSYQFGGNYEHRQHIYLGNGKEFDRTKWYQFIPADKIVNK